MCVCVRERDNKASTATNVYVYMRACVHVCGWERERENERESGIDSLRCVCVSYT